jgi:hypothetical protein
MTSFRFLHPTIFIPWKPRFARDFSADFGITHILYPSFATVCTLFSILGTCNVVTKIYTLNKAHATRYSVAPPRNSERYRCFNYQGTCYGSKRSKLHVIICIECYKKHTNSMFSIKYIFRKQVVLWVSSIISKHHQLGKALITMLLKNYTCLGSAGLAD